MIYAGAVTVWSAADFHSAVHVQKKIINRAGKITHVPRLCMLQILNGTLPLHDPGSAVHQATLRFLNAVMPGASLTDLDVAAGEAPLDPPAKRRLVATISL